MIEISPNPFTPQSGLEPKILGGREGFIRGFIQLIEKRNKGDYVHLLLLGEWGMGKTSLLKFYKKIAQNRGFQAVYTSFSKSSKKDSPLDILYALMEEICFGLGISFQPEVNKIVAKKNLGLLMVDFLIRIFDAQNTKLFTVLIDDVQNISGLPQILDILRLALSNEQLLSRTNYLFVLASTPKGWNSFLERYDPIGRFFRTKQVLRKLNKHELNFTIKQTLLNSGVKFTEDITEKICFYTEGHPYELQLLASHLYDNQKMGMVDMDSLEVAILNTLKDLGIEYFASLYNKASEREKELLNIFAEKRKYLSVSEVKEILIFEKRTRGFPVANIKNFIYRLEDKGLLIREEKKYRILDNMFSEYILRFK